MISYACYFISKAVFVSACARHHVGIASQTQHDKLIELNNILLFENTNPANPNLLELDDAAPPELTPVDFASRAG